MDKRSPFFIGMMAAAGVAVTYGLVELVIRARSVLVLHSLESHDSALGRLNARFHVQQQLTHLLTSKGSALAGGVLGAGEFVLSAASSAVIVVVLVVYFLADLPRIKLFGYRLAPIPGAPGSS